jgi:hypothetical protein
MVAERCGTAKTALQLTPIIAWRSSQICALADDAVGAANATGQSE